MTATSTPTALAASPGPATGRSRLDWVGLAARLVLGGVLLYAGLVKLPNLEASVLSVRAYRLLPYDVAAVVGYALPIVEVAAGALLVAGLFTRVTAAIGALAMVAFIIGISWAWSQGLSIDCGCFGPGGEIAKEKALALYPWEIARDVGLLLCGALLVRRPHTPFSLDDWLFRPVTDADLPDLDDADDTDTKENR